VRARGAESATRATPYSPSAIVKIICVSPASSLRALRAEALVLAHGKGHAPAAQRLHTNHLHDADAPRHLGEGDQIDDLVRDHICSETERGPACAVARRLDSRACHQQRLHDRVPAPNYSEEQRRVAIIIEAGARREQRAHHVCVASMRSELQRRGDLSRECIHSGVCRNLSFGFDHWFLFSRPGDDMLVAEKLRVFSR
jgi:hypothetical protein